MRSGIIVLPEYAIGDIANKKVMTEMKNRLNFIISRFFYQKNMQLKLKATKTHKLCRQALTHLLRCNFCAPPS
ncbi:hypothetical protein EEI76_22355 (plasmid) [Enterobacter cloacae]|nr:hypothetical protein EEI76_22355 [Enterobacter cloacae]